jgi:hypothetical protein
MATKPQSNEVKTPTQPRKIQVTTPEPETYPKNAREINFKQAAADVARNHKKDVAGRKTTVKETK